MSMHTELLNVFRQITNLEIQEENLFCELFKPHFLKKGDYTISIV